LIPAVLSLLLACPLYAFEVPNGNAGSVSASSIALTEPAPDEVVVVINDNAFGGNHAGIFAGSLLFDPAGSYRNIRGRDKDWHEPTLVDYARYQMLDGLKIRFYRFRLQSQAFSAIVQRMLTAAPTPPLFCASAVQNLLEDIPPFNAIERASWTTPTALGQLLDTLTHGAAAAGICQKPDASPCWVR
jgi:hypothetical protein